VSRIFYALTALAAVWIWLFPQADLAAILVLVLLPWAALVPVAVSPHLYRFDDQRNDVRPNLAYAAIMAGLALAACAMYDVGVLEWPRALAAGALLVALLSCAQLRCSAASRGRASVALSLCLINCFYGYGAVALVDSKLDVAARNHYQVEVLARHSSASYRSRSYYLRLAPWGPRSYPRDVLVRRALYARLPRGSTACVEQGAGALGISWYVVSACD